MKTKKKECKCRKEKISLSSAFHTKIESEWVANFFVSPFARSILSSSPPLHAKWRGRNEQISHGWCDLHDSTHFHLCYAATFSIFFEYYIAAARWCWRGNWIILELLNIEELFLSFCIFRALYWKKISRPWLFIPPHVFPSRPSFHCCSQEAIIFSRGPFHLIFSISHCRVL